jgi:hypothetical protein
MYCDFIYFGSGHPITLRPCARAALATRFVVGSHDKVRVGVSLVPQKSGGDVNRVEGSHRNSERPAGAQAHGRIHFH